MESLNIAVVPTEKGLKAQRVTQTFVLEGQGPIRYWYSLDLTTTGPGSVTKPLIEKAKQRVPPQCRLNEIR